MEFILFIPQKNLDGEELIGSTQLFFIISHIENFQ